MMLILYSTFLLLNSKQCIPATSDVPFENNEKLWQKSESVCPNKMELPSGKIYACTLTDSVSIFIDSKPSGYRVTGEIQTDFMSNVRNVTLLLQDIMTVIKNACFKSQIDILCDSADDLDYFYQNQEICSEVSLKNTWKSKWKRVYYSFLSASLSRLGLTSHQKGKKIHCSFEIPLVELQQKQPLTIRQKVPGKNNGTIIRIRHRVHFDRDTVMFLILFFILSFLGPRILHNSVSRILICISLGALLCILLIAFFLVRDLGKTTVGRIGVLSAVLFGTLSVVSESLFHSLFPMLVTSLRNDRHLQAGSLVTGLAVIGLFRYFNLEKYISNLAFALLRMSQLVLLGFAFISNRILCLCFFTLPVFAYSFVVTLRYLKRNKYGVAHDSFPSYVYREAAVGHRLPCNILSGTWDEKMRKYELEGTIQTRKCLEKLGREIRSNVNVVTRTNDPNTIAHWAGVS